MSTPTILFSENQIARRVEDVARLIAQHRPQPDLAVPILVGGFVFAADLLRALENVGCSLPVEFVRFASYGAERSTRNEPVLTAGEDIVVENRHVLLIDGVLDSGRTLKAAHRHLLSRGAQSILSVVAVDKCLAGTSLRADQALFSDVSGFLVGYGLDDGGLHRGKAFIARID